MQMQNVGFEFCDSSIALFPFNPVQLSVVII